MKINRAETNHQFEKQNLVTISDKSGCYDLYKCSLCGLKGKSYQLDSIDIDGRKKNFMSCPKAEGKKFIIISKCYAQSPQFKNLIPGSKHKIIDPPKEEKHSKNGVRGYWVMGVGEPVLVLFNEIETK